MGSDTETTYHHTIPIKLLLSQQKPNRFSLNGWSLISLFMLIIVFVLVREIKLQKLQLEEERDRHLETTDKLSYAEWTLQSLASEKKAGLIGTIKGWFK